MEKRVDMKKITFRNETPADYRAVENLTREAFWNVYKPGCDEHFILHNFRTRSEFVPELDIIMEEDGIFKAGDLTLCVKKIDGGLYLESKGISLELADLNFPIAVRSRQSGDFVECNDGSHRSVSKILDNWKTRSMRDKIPLIQKIDGSLCGIKCIWGAVYGFENWIAGGTGCP